MPTTNPVPSQDPSDLLFNAGKLDEVVSGPNATYTDRLGISRRTMAGIDAAADMVLSGLGYAPPVAYASGIALTLTTQTVEYAEEVYAPKVASLPFTTSGAFETAKFRLIQGVASADLPALVGQDLQEYAALRAYTGSATRIYITGLMVTAKPAGIAGIFQYDRTDMTSADNGGTIIVDAGGRRWKRDYSGPVHSEWFVIGNGVADDTIPIVESMAYCRAKNKTLLLSGSVRFIASSVPSGKKHLGTGGYYVNGCSMLSINDAELIIDGKIGFDLAGVDKTLVQGFKVTTTGREMTEVDQNNTSPTLFWSGSGTKTSAIYRDIIVDNGVTNLTGAYRVGSVIRENGCKSFIAENISANNTILTVGCFNSENVYIGTIYGSNIETNVYISNCAKFSINNLYHINDVIQRDYWVGRLGSPVREINGMDNVLTEQCGSGTVTGLHTVFAHERACYIQSNKIHLSGCLTINCDGYKLVGSTYTYQAHDVYADDCHCVIDEAWTATRGRINNWLLTTYWSKGINLQNSTIRNTVFGRNCVQAVCSIGLQDGSTVENIHIKNVSGTNVVRFSYGFLSSKTPAQLAAMSPPGSFVSVRNLLIENSYIKEDNFRSAGSLFELRETGASADALLNYAAENIKIRNNTVELPADQLNRDDWLYDVRWVNGLESEDNKVNLPFLNNGFFTSAITHPYANIFMNEPHMKHSANVGALMTALGNLSVLAGSTVKFSRTDGIKQSNVSAAAYANGTMLDGRVVAEIFGKGYSSIATTRDFGLEMTASGNFYFGKIIAGVKTDQVGTPPVTLSVSGVGIDIRGDTAPSVDYHLKMTLV